MNVRIRVAHVITRLCQGGAQVNTFHSVRLATPDRFEVDLISGPTGGPEGSIESSIREAGLKITAIPTLVRNPSPLKDWQALRDLTQCFRARQYHIVHTHTSKAGFIGRWAAHRAGTPIIIHTPHGHIYDGYFRSLTARVYLALERRAARWTDRMVCLTGNEKAVYEKLSIGDPAKYTEIFSGIDLSAFKNIAAERDAVREEFAIPKNAFVVGGVGRLERVKGFTYLIGAARALSESIPDLHVLIAGDGAERQRLRTEAAALGSRVHFTGMRADIARLMAGMDILAVPSLNEGMGRVVLEAGASGLPVIAARVGGLPDVVEDGVTGILVPPRNPAALAEALASLASAPERRTAMGAAARRKVVPAFGLEAMVARIEALYEELIKEKHIVP